MNSVSKRCLGLFLVFSFHHSASAAEICGNGIDDNGNGYADEGCFSNWAMGVCENPMSCKTTGDIGPKTGAYVYQLPPDLNPAVPYGPPLQFKRTYMSMYAPPATNYRTAMGPHWQHNWMSWLDKSGTSAIVHLVTGPDVKFTFSTTNTGYDYYTPQPGFHVQYLRQATTSPFNWEMKTLTGEVYKYNWSSPVGKLIEVDNTLATPQKATINYLTSGTDLGQIDTIVDASQHKRFSFTYTSGEVTAVSYQTGSGASWTTQVTLGFGYTSTNPTTVTIASSTIQTNSYTSNYLTSIQDAASNHIVDVSYVAAAPGKVASVTTGEGGIGYDYSSSNTQCTAQTVLFFNVANATSCNVDTDCGTNPVTGTPWKCGGKTGSGTTGKCYRAARCLTTTSPSEDLITTVAPITPCTGACAPTAQYSWNTTTLDLKGIKLADNNWTSFQRNGNGLVTMKAEGDTDDDPTNGGGVDTWLFYTNANFPGRVTERRQKSNISTSTCDSGTSTSGCMRTQYVWNSDGLLGSREDDGTTYTTATSATPFAYTTSYSYDSLGRRTLIDGPLAGSDDVTQYIYWSSADVLIDGYLNLVKRKKDTANFVTTTLDKYDVFGNAGTTIDPDGTPTCRIWDSNRNYLSQDREAMAGQTDCTSINSLDLVTSYVRDSWLRLTRTTRPLGDCQINEYDTYGRTLDTKFRDDCVATNAGNTLAKSYDSNGLLTKAELQDSTGAVTYRQQGSYLDGSQVDGIVNPVSPSYSRNTTYYSDGQPDVTSFENGLGKTEQFWDAENREATRARYENSSTHDDWTLHYPNSDTNATRLPASVSDSTGITLTTIRDDLNRVNETISPNSFTTLYVYDAASRLTTLTEGITAGSGGTTHSFTYDNMGRKLTEDYGSESCSGSNPVEVQYTYDSVGSCPSGATCSKLGGRLAYVKQVLMCTSVSPYHLDQETFYGYDPAGRLISEEIDDPSPRAVLQSYSYDKNGNPTGVTAPSGASQLYTLGGSGNSDTNLISTIARSVSGVSTTLLSGIQYAPLGPVIQYDQANTIGGNQIRATMTRNLAYRATQIKYAATGAAKTQIDYTEDPKGRYVQKLYSNVASGVQSDYLTYDWFDRPTCDAAVSGTCSPTLGTNLKSMISYNTSNARSQVNHYDTQSGNVGYTPSYVSGTDRVGSYGSIAYGWDARGNRTYDDDSASSVDRRDYTFDGRRRVRTVTGSYPRYGSHCLPCWDTVVITYAYDHRDHVVFRDWHDTANGWESQTFYYWDTNDRLIEAKFVPTASNPANYTIYDYYWFGNRPVASWAVDQSANTARYFSHTDEANRILEVYSWPTSGDAADVYSRNPETFGWDVVVNGASFFQPIALNGGILDDSTLARSTSSIIERPDMILASGLYYDPMTETTLQESGRWPNSAYSVGSHSPSLGLRNGTVPQFGSLQRRQSCAASRVKPCLNCDAPVSTVGLSLMSRPAAAGLRGGILKNPVFPNGGGTFMQSLSGDCHNDERCTACEWGCGFNLWWYCFIDVEPGDSVWWCWLMSYEQFGTCIGFGCLAPGQPCFCSD